MGTKTKLKALKRTEGWAGRVSSVMRSPTEDRSVGRVGAQPSLAHSSRTRTNVSRRPVWALHKAELQRAHRWPPGLPTRGKRRAEGWGW